MGYGFFCRTILSRPGSLRTDRKGDGPCFGNPGGEAGPEHALRGEFFRGDGSLLLLSERSGLSSDQASFHCEGDEIGAGGYG